jgi:LPS-assembly lipoprotein
VNTRALAQVPRRRLLARAGAVAALALLAAVSSVLPGCGFELRRPPELQLKRIQLAGFDRYSPLADELRRQLRQSPGVQLVESASQADAVLEAIADTSTQVVAASTAAGQVRELTLRATLKFRVRSASGNELIGPTDLSQSREMSYAENDALAKEHEAQMLLRNMHGDIANQVLRRLAALAPAAEPGPAASAPH